MNLITHDSFSIWNESELFSVDGWGLALPTHNLVYITCHYMWQISSQFSNWSIFRVELTTNPFFSQVHT